MIIYKQTPVTLSKTENFRFNKRMERLKQPTVSIPEKRGTEKSAPVREQSKCISLKESCNGKPMNPCTFTYRFKLILKTNNLPLDLNVHSLRHTNASLLIAQGVDVRTVASLLGHAQASTTLDIYAHAFDKNKRKAQEKLGKAIGL